MSRQYHLDKSKMIDVFKVYLDDLHGDSKFELPIISETTLLSNPNFNYQLYLLLLYQSNRDSSESRRYITYEKALNFLCQSNLIKKSKVAKERITELITNGDEFVYMEDDKIYFDTINIKFIRVPTRVVKNLIWEHSSCIKLMIVYLVLIKMCGKSIISREYLASSIGINNVKTISNYTNRLVELGYIDVVQSFDSVDKKKKNRYIWMGDF